MNATVTPIRRRDRSWRKEANCLDADPAIFDDRDDESAEAKAAREDVARDFCGGCPVIANCAAFAIRMQVTTGFLAGMNAGERAETGRRLRRAEREAAAAELEMTA